MTWVIDPAHSEIQFSAKHLMISTVRGRFNAFTGTIDADENKVTAAKIDVQIDASSLVTGEERRDTHLRSSDFLDVERYPYITFTSTRVELLDETHGKLSGARGALKDSTIERRFKRYGDWAGLAFWLYLTRGWVEDGLPV